MVGPADLLGGLVLSANRTIAFRIGNLAVAHPIANDKTAAKRTTAAAFVANLSSTWTARSSSIRLRLLTADA